MAGDRQATEGFQVSGRRIEKVFKTDDHSTIAIAGFKLFGAKVRENLTGELERNDAYHELIAMNRGCCG